MEKRLYLSLADVDSCSLPQGAVAASGSTVFTPDETANGTFDLSAAGIKPATYLLHHWRR